MKVGQRMSELSRKKREEGSHLTVCRDTSSVALYHSIPSLLGRENWWEKLTTRLQENKPETVYTKETSLQLCRGHPCQRQPGEDGNEKDQENQDETQVKGFLKITSQFPMQIL